MTDAVFCPKWLVISPIILLTSTSKFPFLKCSPIGDRWGTGVQGEQLELWWGQTWFCPRRELLALAHLLMSWS